MLAASCAGAARLAAQEPSEPEELVTDRPDVTESASVVRAGEIQVETGVTLEDLDEGQRTFTAPGTLVRIGLGGPLEARVGWAGWNDEVDGPSGAGDADLGFKLALRREATGPDLSLLAAASLPVGEEPFGSGVVEPEMKAIAAHDLSRRVGLGVNLGAAWPEGDEGSRDLLLSWSTALGIDVAGAVGMFVEYFGEALEGETAAHSFDGGFTLGVGPDLQLDASAGATVSGPGQRWFVGTGLAFRFSP